VALVAPSPALPPRKALPGREQVIGLALRGPQGEYGADACLWERTERLARVAAERLLERSGGRLELIENHLARSGRRPEEIESQYARCDLVITSRFHGAMLALRHGVPFVAIDQIRGGGKVEPLLAGRGWPHVFRAEDAGEEDVARAAAAAIAVESRPILCNRTLAALATALAAHAQKTPL
jgi:hypothetical protein